VTRSRFRAAEISAINGASLIGQILDWPSVSGKLIFSRDQSYIVGRRVIPDQPR
jgi:hypothetical protein